MDTDVPEEIVAYIFMVIFATFKTITFYFPSKNRRKMWNWDRLSPNTAVLSSRYNSTNAP
jgi:hypothetical protein